MVAGIYQIPPGLIAQIQQPLQDLGPVAVEPACGKTPHILQQHGARADLFDEPERLREQIPLVILAKLLPCD
jgi:hypothetical protein